MVLAAVALMLGWSGSVDAMTVTVLASISALVTSAGLIGNDVTDGTVQLVLARSLTRNEYLAGRFLGAVTLVVLAGGLILACLFAGTLLNSHEHRDGAEFVAIGVGMLAHLLWQTALCFALSTFTPGRGDALVYLLLLLASQLLAYSAADVVWPWLASVFYWWAAQLWNALAYSGASPAFWEDLVRWGRNGAVALLLGSVVFHQREFSYGAG
jgi:ABC-type transport system involved in multi-copper enzyme maturation permease subunit